MYFVDRQAKCLQRKKEKMFERERERDVRHGLIDRFNAVANGEFIDDLL